MMAAICFVNAKLKFAFSHDTFWVEFKSGLALVTWSFVSFIFGGVDAHYVFLTLALIANSDFWEITGFVLGFSQIFAVTMFGRVTRWLVAFLASWWWVFIAMSIAVNFSASSSIALYMAFAFSNLVAMIKLARLYE